MSTPPPPSPPPRNVYGQAFLVALAAGWLTLVTTGLVIVARYDNRSGIAAAARHAWPGASRLPHDAARPTLIMVAHPRCTCTRASLAELAEIMARAHGHVRAYVVFTRPGRLTGDSATFDLWQRAARIPGVTVVRDDDGEEAAAFGAETSGQIYVYATSGQLLFSGGTTASRGHAGDNAGRASIVAILRGERPPRTSTPVFGCSIHGSGEQRQEAARHAHDTHQH